MNLLKFKSAIAKKMNETKYNKSVNIGHIQESVKSNTYSYCKIPRVIQLSTIRMITNTLHTVYLVNDGLFLSVSSIISPVSSLLIFNFISRFNNFEALQYLKAKVQ